MSYAQEKSELRAVWLTNVDSNVLSSDQSISDAMDYLASIGINVVFPVVYNRGYTLYPSRIMDSLFNTSVLPSSPFVNRDFLERMVIEAHRNGIEVIPWFEFGFATSYSLNGGHIIAQFPAWALKNASGNLVVDNGFDWMSAINPDAQQFMMSLMMEVLDNYDVDGVQGDDRLPAMPVEGGYDSVTAGIYKSEHAGQAPPSDNFNAAWMRWRADKLTQFLSRLRDSVKARGNNVILSIAPTPYYWGYRELLQDSKTWAQQGLADNLIPQLYGYTIGDFTYALNTTWNDVGQYQPASFASGLLAKVGTYVVDTVLLGQMLTATRAKAVKGECLFFYEGLRANNNRVGNFLRTQFYQTPAVPSYRDGKRWIAKAQIVNETDEGAVKSGAWSVYQMKGYQGPIYRTDDTLHYTGIRYDFVVDNSAYYDVYTFRTPNTPWTQQASYTLYGDVDSVAVTVDQSDLSHKGWYRIGTVFVSPGTRSIVKLDNARLEPGKYLVADAVMIMLNRKLSPDVPVSVTKDAPVKASEPDAFGLVNNYPNPFNPGTTIGFRVPPARRFSGVGAGSCWVKLVVYDLLGREVALLVNEKMEPGRYTVRFDASGFASGVYLYRLDAGGFVETRTMILLK
jgi:uncharacterized lipoprotein YddW (UPF0748 family)